MTDLLSTQRPTRRFLDENFTFSSWDDLKPLFDALKNRPLKSADDLRQWFVDRSELESYLAENFAWRYIRMTCDTADEALLARFNEFVEHIQPEFTSFSNDLDKKAVESPHLAELNDEGFPIAIRSMKRQIELFREENIPLTTQIQTLEQQYGAIAGAMTVVLGGRDGEPEEMTLQRASDRLQEPDRAVRETAYRAIQQRRMQDKDRLDELFDQLRGLRHRVAQNTGFANYRDYMFAALGRFDYTPDDCFRFHEAVAETLVPLLDGLATARKNELGLGELRPWDLKVDPQNRSPLKPFETGDELLEKTIEVFNRLDPFLGDCLRIMKRMGQLDLTSRKGKAPGGYNYPLDETGVPFIFMNATSNLRDMVTLLHEGGHAVHSIVTRNLLLNAFKHTPSEVAELASMSMELLTLDHWDVFFPNPDDLKRAKIQHLESIVETLPWVATVDKFQHWLYENPAHNLDERKEAWLRIYDQFSDDVTDWSSLETYKEYIWQKQLHIYEVPFYYIEYGIAQLGAVGVWKNFRENPKRGLEGYLNALRLGYTRPMSEIYAAAYVPFDFSREHIASLMNFVNEELEALRSS
ncbi:MAG: M3 family oligoendopeptidase [Cytophagaceae bacterium]|nr:M3 family oligoendopeptidase [Cytophagaceae bacterium]